MKSTLIKWSHPRAAKLFIPIIGISPPGCDEENPAGYALHAGLHQCEYLIRAKADNHDRNNAYDPEIHFPNTVNEKRRS